MCPTCTLLGSRYCCRLYYNYNNITTRRGENNYSSHTNSSKTNIFLPVEIRNQIKVSLCTRGGTFSCSNLLKGNCGLHTLHSQSFLLNLKRGASYKCQECPITWNIEPSFEMYSGVNIFQNSPRITGEKFLIFGIWGKVWWNSIPRVLSRFGTGKC